MPGLKLDCTVTELTDATISLRESGSDRAVTIRRDRLVFGLRKAPALIHCCREITAQQFRFAIGTEWQGDFPAGLSVYNPKQTIEMLHHGLAFRTALRIRACLDRSKQLPNKGSEICRFVHLRGRYRVQKDSRICKSSSQPFRVKVEL